MLSEEKRTRERNKYEQTLFEKILGRIPVFKSVQVVLEDVML